MVPFGASSTSASYRRASSVSLDLVVEDFIVSDPIDDLVGGRVDSPVGDLVDDPVGAPDVGASEVGAADVGATASFSVVAATTCRVDGARRLSPV